MKKFVTLFAGILFAASLASIANAQAAGPTGGGLKVTGNQAGANGIKGGPVGAKILKQLSLTPDQMKQIRALGKAFQEKRQQLPQEGGQPNKKDLAALRKQFMSDLANTLTPAQRDKLKELLLARRNQNKAGQVRGGAVGTGTGAGTGTGTGTATGSGTSKGGG